MYYSLFSTFNKYIIVLGTYLYVMNYILFSRYKHIIYYKDYLKAKILVIQYYFY